MLFDIEKHDQHKTAVLEDNGKGYTYGTLCRDASALGDALAPRTLAFCCCSDTYGSLCGYVGFLSAGVVPLMLDEKLDRGLLKGLIAAYRPQYLWVQQEQVADFPACTPLLSLAGYLLLGTGNAHFPIAPQLALLLTTSGSTGSPKLVRQSHHNIWSNATAITRYLSIGAEERPISTLPMHYTYGLSILQSHLLAGATMLLTGKSVIEQGFWDFFAAEQATSFGGVPFTYELLRRVGFFEMELPSLRYFTQAGGKLPLTLHESCARYAEKTGKQFFVMYGQAEATARMGYLPAGKALEKCGCMGIAIPGGRFSLIDAAGSEITSPETVGELVYHGDNVTLGYAESIADLARGDDRQGELVTGDMAKFDLDGYFSIVGRKKRFLKMFGSRISLDECEQLIKARFTGLDCACFGVDDRMTLCVAGGDPDAAADFLSATLGLHRRAIVARSVAEIPKNSAGKTLYTRLEDAQ